MGTTPSSLRPEPSTIRLGSLFDSLVAASLDLANLAHWTGSGRHAAAALHLQRAAFHVHEAGEALEEGVTRGRS